MGRLTDYDVNVLKEMVEQMHRLYRNLANPTVIFSLITIYALAITKFGASETEDFDSDYFWEHAKTFDQILSNDGFIPAVDFVIDDIVNAESFNLVPEADQLQKIEGVGPVLAKRVVEHDGPIDEVKGVGSNLKERIKQYTNGTQST